MNCRSPNEMAKVELTSPAPKVDWTKADDMRIGEVIGKVTLSRCNAMVAGGTWLVVVPLNVAGLKGDTQGRDEALVVYEELYASPTNVDHLLVVRLAFGIGVRRVVALVVEDGALRQARLHLAGGLLVRCVADAQAEHDEGLLRQVEQRGDLFRIVAHGADIDGAET